MDLQITVVVSAVILLISLIAFPKFRTEVFLAIQKIRKMITSKRFLVMAIATWFNYKGIDIDSSWIWLAGFYIGIDTMQNHDVFKAFSEFIRTRKGKAIPESAEK